MNKTGLIILTVFIAAGVSFGTVKMMNNQDQTVSFEQEKTPVRFASSQSGEDMADTYPDFTQAAAIASQQVVHIKVQIASQGYSPVSQGAMASGSGVILSEDGYIVTNNHVVGEASSVEVVLADRRTFAARLIGRDPNTDLALIKINATGLNPVKIGNSDLVQVGQWVLAIGYPFSLNTTVTAGIISAKERSIGIIGSKGEGSAPIEAFIQTDAAINPGNSGGALVNTAGELIGINAAIASQTGSYAGYGFAIPVNLAKKIVNDLREFGSVKRGLLGVAFPSPATEDQELIERGIAPGSIKGVYITGIQPNSAAAAAGLQEGDIIQSINGNTVNSSVELSERIARRHPGDKIALTYLRKGEVLSSSAILKDLEPDRLATNTGPSLNDIYNKLGAKFAPINDRIKQGYGISSGMLVTAIARGGFFEKVGIQPGSIIVGVNGVQVNTPMELNKTLMSATRGTIRIACITPEGSRVLFNLSLGA
ncbi:trypsin-like peptidase domain-containing protein [Mucilaginibacter puniceus]